MDECEDMQSGRLDPAKLDVAAKPRRKLRKRNRPEPTAELREWEKAAERRAYARPHPPGIMLEPTGLGDEHWTSPHSDVELWTLQLADAFGTRSRAVVATFMGQLEALCGNDHWDETAQQWRLDENQLSAALAVVSSVKPRNEMEASLAAQMVAVHLLTMKLAERAIKYDYDTRTAAAAGKLARTYVMQLEALNRLRKPNRTTKQSIKVSKELHQHVHYHHDRGGGKPVRQSHATHAEGVAELPSLPCPDPEGQSVPITSRARQAKVPDARRDEPGRSQG